MNKTARPLSFDIIQLLKLPIEGDLAVTKCYPNPTRFSSVQRRKVGDKFSFSDGAITGNGGISLPDVGTLVTASNRKTDLSRTAHAILGLERRRRFDRHWCRRTFVSPRA